MRKFKANESFVLFNCMVLIAARRFFFSFFTVHHLTASKFDQLNNLFIFFLCTCLGLRRLSTSAVISPNFLMKSCHWWIYGGGGGVARLLNPAPGKARQCVEHSTDGWKTSHFSSLFHSEGSIVWGG